MIARRLALMVALALLLGGVAVPLHAQGSGDDVQALLAAWPGPLRGYSEQGATAAAIIEGYSVYYGVSPRLLLALLEATSGLVTSRTASSAALRHPFGRSGPEGFTQQIAWACRELRAGLGPYERAPTVRFTDGTSVTLNLDQAPEGVAVQRFLAIGRTQPEWRALVDRFLAAFQQLFDNLLPDRPALPPPPTGGFLQRPWPDGTQVYHLAFFDHIYPTVDAGDDGNAYVVDYLGRSGMQYDGHDGHDYYFPDQPVGTPILAAAAGLAYARTVRGNGVVIIHPGGWETVYWHLDRFDERFTGVINGAGVAVRAGDVLGTSGATGFVTGSPHLHFEVRYQGRVTDPYGWYGAGPDPCGAYAGCVASRWLWHPALLGSAGFTPPGTRALPDQQPPVATLTVNPRPDVLLLAPLDGHPLQSVGAGLPQQAGELQLVAGRYGQAVVVPAGGGLAYPTSGNLRLAAGTISLWVQVPARDEAPGEAGYVLATSSDPAGPAGAGTLFALRRVPTGGTFHWSFYTIQPQARNGTHDLRTGDQLTPGWHHLAISWEAATGSKTLYLDGVPAARASGVVLPRQAGVAIEIGRLGASGGYAGMAMDELAIFNRPLSDADVAALATLGGPLAGGQTRTATREIVLDINGMDAEGGVVSVQIGRDGQFEAPLPYYDSFRWTLPEAPGRYELAVRMTDRAGNTTVVRAPVELAGTP